MPDSEISAIKLPPHSIESEQSLIGGLLLDNAAWDRIADVVREADFYSDDHRRIFRHIGRLLEQGRPADVITVFESIKNAGEVEATGGLAYLSEIANNTPSAASVRRYAEIVHERALLRRLVAAGDEIAASALSPQGREAKALVDQAEAKIFEIAELGMRAGQGFVDLQSLVDQAMERITHLSERPEGSEVTGLPTGFRDLDAKTAGLQAGDMIIVAGRPSMGKTAFALNICEHVAVDLKLPVGIFSLEMPGSQLALRFMSSVARIDQQRLRSGRLNDVDWQNLARAFEILHDVPIYVDETPGLSITDLRARARRLYRQCGRLELLVVDYLQLMSVSRPGENRATEISEISRSLKALAKELNVPVIALSQLNRDLEKRPNKRPVMSDLRESGAIEQDADLILFLYRDEVYNPDSPEKGLAEIIVGKHRNGPTGMVPLTFLGEQTKFVNAARPGQY